jgi:hypothetical protein
MSSLKTTFLAIAAIAATVHVWHDHQRALAEHRLTAAADASGFVPVLMAEGAPRDVVLILAPVNCPSAAAQQAHSIETKLNELGIRNQRTNSYALRPTPDNRAEIDQTALVLNGGAPVVIINGRGKAHPTPEEVLAEYRRSGA